MKKSYFIMLMALMCMFSCRTENTSDTLSDQTHKSKFDASFKEVLQATKSPDESSLMAKVQDFTEDYNPSDFIMDTAKIKKTLKNGEVTEYAIYLKKKNETEIGVFYNLVFTKKIDSWKKYLVKFTPAIIPETNNKVGYKCEFISKKAQASKCGSSFYMTEYFQCWAGHTDSNDGDCNGCWRLGSYGIANTCDEEAPDDFNGAGDNYGGGATPNVDGLIHVYADPSHWALYNSLSAENKFKCYQALLLSSDTSYVNFSIDFFSSNPTVTIQQFQHWFLNSNGTPKIKFNNPSSNGSVLVLSNMLEFKNFVETLKNPIIFEGSDIESINSNTKITKFKAKFAMAIPVYLNVHAKSVLENPNTSAIEFDLQEVNSFKSGVSAFLTWNQDSYDHNVTNNVAQINLNGHFDIGVKIGDFDFTYTETYLIKAKYNTVNGNAISISGAAE